MRRIFFVTLLIGAMLAAQAPVVSADGAACASDAPSVQLGARTVIQCSGFSPNTPLWVYAVEPNGAALVITQPFYLNTLGGPLKSDGQGNVSFVFDTRLTTEYALRKSGLDYYAQLGEWTFVVQQLAPGGKIAQQSQTSVRVTGGTEGVSGAQLNISPITVVKGSDTTFSIYGSGFGANEVVTIWVEQPALCSSHTQHYVYAGVPYSQIFIGGVSTLFWDDVKTDSAGHFTYTDALAPMVCDGARHFVARGNTSGLGAEANLSVSSSAVTENAFLEVSPQVASPVDTVLTFRAQGFDAYEVLSCWGTTPDGRALAFPYDVLNSVLKTDAAGQAAFSFTTGAIHDPLVASIIGSEGAFGEWKMSCRGNTSGRVGIASYVLAGGMIDP